MILATATGLRRPGAVPPRPRRRLRRPVRPARAEADAYYAIDHAAAPSGPERASIMRQALAGHDWSKQYYGLDVERWLAEHVEPGRPAHGRNGLGHLLNEDVISMPDTWEYPWYAAWDLAFHTLALGMVDPNFAVASSTHAAGAVPPPQWPAAGLRVELRRRQPASPCVGHRVRASDLAHGGRRGPGLPGGLVPEAAAQLHLVGEPQGSGRQQRVPGRVPGPGQHRRVRPQRPAPTGGTLEQADGTAWMALFSQNMLELAIELAAETRPTSRWSSSSSSTSS